MTQNEKPIAYCPLNDVEAFEFPFYIKKGVGVESDQILLEIHLWHMTDNDKEAMGELLEINTPEQLGEAGYNRDDRGVFIIGEVETWIEKPDYPTMQ
ncbi:MAG: hypothetical protein P1S46_07030 [bacterium]|nr:hypothetical protein [bacterium]MDT8395686.1 hypothetical protein [bacterium]